jgi:hypothetical protein
LDYILVGVMLVDLNYYQYKRETDTMLQYLAIPKDLVDRLLQLDVQYRFSKIKWLDN